MGGKAKTFCLTIESEWKMMGESVLGWKRGWKRWASEQWIIALMKVHGKHGWSSTNQENNGSNV